MLGLLAWKPKNYLQTLNGLHIRNTFLNIIPFYSTIIYIWEHIIKTCTLLGVNNTIDICFKIYKLVLIVKMPTVIDGVSQLTDIDRQNIGETVKIESVQLTNILMLMKLPPIHKNT